MNRNSPPRSGRRSDVARLLLVDDDGLFRSGLRQLLHANDERIRVVGEAATHEEAIALAGRMLPDVVLMDLELADESNGIEAIEELAIVAPMVRVLVLTGSSSGDDMIDAVVAGAHGYLLKDARINEIVDGVHAVLAGQSVLSPPIAARLLAIVREVDPRPEPPSSLVGALTPREREVLRLMAAGRENAAIAGALQISPRTAKNHVASILDKLDMDNRIQAAVFAVRHGIA